MNGVAQHPERRSERYDSQPQGSVVCPSCSMEASVRDRRLLIPVATDAPLRRCRNCQAILDLSTDRPHVAEPLSSV